MQLPIWICRKFPYLFVIALCLIVIGVSHLVRETLLSPVVIKKGTYENALQTAKSLFIGRDIRTKFGKSHRLSSINNGPLFTKVKIKNMLGKTNQNDSIDILVIDEEERRQRELDRTFPGLRRRMPSVLTIGIAKCGTGVTHRFLALNPYLVPSRNESNILAFDDRYKRGFWYHRNFQRESLKHQITIERGTFYIVTPGVPERIKALNESTKLLVIACDPVERTISHFSHRLALHSSVNESADSFESSVTFKNGSLKADALKYKYDEVIAPWYEYFPRNQILVIDGEKMKRDPLPELKKVETFLGVPHMIRKKNLVFDEKKGFVCIFTDFSHCVGKARGRSHEFVRPALRKKLADAFKPHTKRFVELVGRNFSWS